MKKAMTILYRVHDNLYVNLTNRCPCSCTFCLRQEKDTVSAVDERSLWLEHEPSADEIIADFANYDMTQFNELVFCGYGEPTERLDVLLEIARYAREHFNIRIRVNTNGMADLIWQRDTSSEFDGLVDTISISLNNPDPVKYQKIVRCKFGEKSFEAMLSFAKNVKHHVPQVILTTVETVLTKDEEDQFRRICEELGVTYRIRPWE